jgi:SET domain-containing protein
MLYRSQKIYVDDSPIHGRGVFCCQFINKGEILEECHFIQVPQEYTYPEILSERFFGWPKGTSNLVICLGFGSIFNHSDNEWKADWETDTINKKIIFYSTSDINEGEEILINYQK